MGYTESVLPGFINPAVYGFYMDCYVSFQYINNYGMGNFTLLKSETNFSFSHMGAALQISRIGGKYFYETVGSVNVYGKLFS